MALKKCKACGEQVSSAATACQKCGAPVKKRISGCAAILVIGFVLIVIGVIVSQFTEHPQPNAAKVANGEAVLTKKEQAALAKTEQERVAETEALRKLRAAEELHFQKSGAARVLAKHPTWSRNDCLAVAEKKIYEGMSTEMVRAAWGRPEKINDTIIGGSKSEQWVYNGGSAFVYFEDGVMTALQQSH